MKNIFFDSKGEIYLVDGFNGSGEKVDTIRYFMDCPLILEDGVLFEHLFNRIIAESEIIDIIFNETMRGSSITNFIDEWNKPFTMSNSMSIDYLRLRKTLEYLETDKNKGFVDIRIDFDGVGKNNGMDYSLEFMTLSEMKKYPIKIDNKLDIKETLYKKDGQDSYIGGECVMTLFEVIGAILYEISFYGVPNDRDNAKQKLIDTIDNKNLIEVLELQLNEAIKIENFEEAANIRNLINTYKNLGKKE